MITKLIQSENDYVEHDVTLQNVLDIMTTNRIKYLVLLKDKNLLESLQKGIFFFFMLKILTSNKKH